MPSQEIMREWVAALRSGKFPQGRGRLRSDDSYCCLGVLCEIAVQRGVIAGPVPLMAIRMFGDLGSIERVAYSYDNAMTMPSPAVVEWSGVTDDNCLTCVDQCQCKLTIDRLALMNDRGATFAEIADLIEEQWIVGPVMADVVVPDSPAEIVEQETVSV